MRFFTCHFHSPEGAAKNENDFTSLAKIAYLFYYTKEEVRLAMTRINRETSHLGPPTWNGDLALLQNYLEYLPYLTYPNYNNDHAYNAYTGYNRDQIATLTTSPQRPFHWTNRPQHRQDAKQLGSHNARAYLGNHTF
jgi:hypothetical protein